MPSKILKILLRFGLSACDDRCCHPARLIELRNVGTQGVQMVSTDP